MFCFRNSVATVVISSAIHRPKAPPIGDAILLMQQEFRACASRLANFWGHNSEIRNKKWAKAVMVTMRDRMHRQRGPGIFTSSERQGSIHEKVLLGRRTLTCPKLQPHTTAWKQQSESLLMMVSANQCLDLPPCVVCNTST